MARPKKDPTHCRTEQVNIRLSPTELSRLQEKADTAQTTLTAFVRAAATSKPVRAMPSSSEDFELRAELRRIGVNLNQIAKSLNARQEAMPSSLVRSCEQLEAIFDRMLGHDRQSDPRQEL